MESQEVVLRLTEAADGCVILAAVAEAIQLAEPARAAILAGVGSALRRI